MFLSKEVITKCYTRLLHMYSSTYIPKPEEIEEKVNACFQLMHKFTADVFKKACGEWENSGQKKMPSPIDLRDKCKELMKNSSLKQDFSFVETCFLKDYLSTLNSVDIGNMNEKLQNNLTIWREMLYEDHEHKLCCANDVRFNNSRGHVLCEFHYVLNQEVNGVKTSRLSWLGEIDGDINWTTAELMRCEYESGNVQILNKLTETQRNHVLRVQLMVEKAMKKGNLELSFIKKI